MKPFDINLAKQGKPVCTKDGREARIICFDAMGKYPIVALVKTIKGDQEYSADYTIEGHYYGSNNPGDMDLVMATKKKKGWINLYKNDVYKDRLVPSAYVYESKEVAESFIVRKRCVDTIQIEWEE